MKKYLLAFVMISALCFGARPNKTYSTPAVYQTLDRAAPWSQFTGSQGFFYVFTPVTASQGVCVYVTNLNTTNARTFTALAYQTGDLSTKAIDDFMGGASAEKWVGISLASGQGSPSFTIPQGDTVSFFVAASGAAHIALQFSLESGTAGGTPDAADIFAVSAPACANGTSSTPQSVNNTLPVQLPNSTWIINSIPVSAGSQATVSVAGVTGVRHTATCYAVDLEATTGTACSAQDAVIRDGACGSGTVIWDELLGATAANGSENHANLCGLQLVGTPGNAMCIEFRAASPSCFQRVNLSGFDQ